MSGKKYEEPMTFDDFDNIELEDEHIIEMIVLEPEEIDRHNHVVSASEISEGKEIWESLSRMLGIQHRNKQSEFYDLENFNPDDENWKYNYNEDFEIISSIITNQDTVIGNQNQRVKQGSWVLTLNVLSDDIWGKIQNEELTGASMGALALVDKVNGYSRIHNLVPLEVSLVNRAATGRTFLRKELELEQVIGVYPNEMSCRLKPPTYSDYTRGTRISNGKEYGIIYGRNEEGNLEQQGFRYNKDIWQRNEAESHCIRHKGAFHDIKRKD